MRSWSYFLIPSLVFPGMEFRFDPLAETVINRRGNVLFFSAIPGGHPARAGSIKEQAPGGKEDERPGPEKPIQSAFLRRKENVIAVAAQKISPDFLRRLAFQESFLDEG